MNKANFCRPENEKTGLLDLIKEFPKEVVLAEIGSYAGESAEIFLNSGKIKKIYCIDLWENEVEFDERIKGFDNVEKLKMTNNTASIFPNEFFDVVYIDAKNTYEACKNDILNYFPKVKRNGIMAGHDYYGFKNNVLTYFTEAQKNKASHDYYGIEKKGQGNIIAGHDYYNLKYGMIKVVDDIFGGAHKRFVDTGWMIRAYSTYKFLISLNK